MNRDISIRTTLQPGDVGYLAYLHGVIYSRECGYGFGFERYVLTGLAEFLEQYEAGKHGIWICEHEAKMVGFLMAFNRGDHAQLRYFILLPQYRGLGLGKRLMQGFMDYMAANNFTHAYLWTTEEQHTATALYGKYGFVLTEEKTSSLFDKMLTEQRFDLHLH